MNDGGWIRLHREITNHWIWKDPVKLKWWLDILLMANHTDTKVNIGTQLFDCVRGQTVMSLSHWAVRWNVSKDAARNFLVLLEKDKMISRESIGKSTRITICNYDTYQSTLHDGQTMAVRYTDTNKNDKNVKKKYTDDFDVFFEQYHTITGLKKSDKEPAAKHWNKLTASEKQKALENIQSYFNSLADPKYCKKARTYLADKNFNDEFKPTLPTPTYKLPI